MKQTVPEDGAPLEPKRSTEALLVKDWASAFCSADAGLPPPPLDVDEDEDEDGLPIRGATIIAGSAPPSAVSAYSAMSSSHPLPITTMPVSTEVSTPVRGVDVASTMSARRASGVSLDLPAGRAETPDQFKTPAKKSAQASAAYEAEITRKKKEREDAAAAAKRHAAKAAAAVASKEKTEVAAVAVARKKATEADATTNGRSMAMAGVTGCDSLQESDTSKHTVTDTPDPLLARFAGLKQAALPSRQTSASERHSAKFVDSTEVISRQAGKDLQAGTSMGAIEVSSNDKGQGKGRGSGRSEKLRALMAKFQ